jgi:hypothetical protein
MAGKTTRCGACTRAVRKTQRALVLNGPGGMRAARVCAPCARTGWLLVLGEPTAPRTRARTALSRHVLGEVA